MHRPDKLIRNTIEFVTLVRTTSKPLNLEK